MLGMFSGPCASCCHVGGVCHGARIGLFLPCHPSLAAACDPPSSMRLKDIHQPRRLHDEHQQLIGNLICHCLVAISMICCPLRLPAAVHNYDDFCINQGHFQLIIFCPCRCLADLPPLSVRLVEAIIASNFHWTMMDTWYSLLPMVVQSWPQHLFLVEPLSYQAYRQMIVLPRPFQAVCAPE